MTRYVTDPWLLIGLVFLALYLWWRLMAYVMDRIARALSRTGPGAPMLDTAPGAASYRCTGRDAQNAQKPTSRREARKTNREKVS
jgi:hypothetical protein